MATETESEFVRFLRGVAQAGAGVATAVEAAPAVLQKVDSAINHLVAPATLERVAGAAAVAAMGAIATEARVGAAHPPRPSEPPRAKPSQAKLGCSKHGEVEWFSTIACAGPDCGRIYQTVDPQGPCCAPEDCPCGLRLLPTEAPDGGTFSGLPLCTACFLSLVKSGGRAVRKRTGGAS